MPGPFLAYAGYSAVLKLGHFTPASPDNITGLIAIPASRWFFPQRCNSRVIYSSSGGSLPDVLPANFQPRDLIVSGRFRSDYNPFVQLPIKVGAQVAASFDPNVNQADPVAIIPVLVVLLDVEAMANGQVQYVMGLRGQWQNRTNLFS